MKKILHVFVFCLSAYFLRAQDPHWSQPSNTLLYLNPAFTAIESQYNLGLNFRDQWNVAGKTYRTYMAAADARFTKPKRSPLAIGGIVSSDAPADGMYKTTSAGLTMACLLRLSKQLRMGVGAGVNYMQNSLSADVFKWGQQFNGEVYDSSLPSGEHQGSVGHHYTDVNAGVSFAYDQDLNSLYSSNHRRWLFGYSFNHVTRPNIDLNGGTDKLLIKHVLYLKGSIPLNDKMLLVPSVLYSAQGGAMTELMAGAMVRFTLGQPSKITGNKKGTAFSAGAMLRYKDAFAPTIEYEKGGTIFALSYDVNISGFSTATRFRGGPELCVRIHSLKNGGRVQDSRSTRKRRSSSGRGRVRR